MTAPEDHPTPHGIGAAIRSARFARGLRQKDVAAVAGISAPYLALIELGRRVPPQDVRERLASALHLPRDRFRAEDPDGLAEALAHVADDWAPEEGADALVAQFPRAARLIVDLVRRVKDHEIAESASKLESRLSGHLHEVLAAASSLTATAAILEEDNLDLNWRRRFVRNIGEDASRLQSAALALSEALEGPNEGGTPPR